MHAANYIDTTRMIDHFLVNVLDIYIELSSLDACICVCGRPTGRFIAREVHAWPAAYVNVGWAPVDRMRGTRGIHVAISWYVLLSPSGINVESSAIYVF